MGINRVKDHKGRLRIQLSKRWPDGSRFRRYFLNATVAKKTLARIEEAIAMGTWRDLQEELRRGVQADMKVAEFAPLYLEEYCKLATRISRSKNTTLIRLWRSLGVFR